PGTGRPRGDTLRMTETNTAPALNITDVVTDGPIAPRVLNATWPNVLHTRISEIVKQQGPAPWAQLVIADERNLVTLIATPPGSSVVTRRTARPSGACSKRGVRSQEGMNPSRPTLSPSYG